MAAKADIRGAALRNVELRGLSFDNADLLGVDFEDSDLSGCSFRKTELGYVNFENAELRDAYFFGVKLAGVDFSKADLAGAVFNNVALEDCKIESAYLYGARIGGHRITRLIARKRNSQGLELFAFATYGGGVVVHSRMQTLLLDEYRSYAATIGEMAGETMAILNYFIDAARPEKPSSNLILIPHSTYRASGRVCFQHRQDNNTMAATVAAALAAKADLSGAVLHGEFLPGVDFTEALLQNANFSSATLSGCVFRRADLYSANFFNANLENANFSDTNLSGVIMWQANAKGADFTGARFQNSNLRDVNMDGARIGEHRLKGFIMSKYNSKWKGFYAFETSDGNILVHTYSETLLIDEYRKHAKTIENAKERNEVLSILDQFQTRFDAVRQLRSLSVTPAKFNAEYRY